MYITADALSAAKEKFDDLKKETNLCMDYLENSGLPLVDFRLYRNNTRKGKSNTVEILKLAIARIMRINEALGANYSPDEITELLKAVQIRFSFDNEADDHHLQKNTNKLLHDVMTKLQQMQMQGGEQRDHMSLRLSKIEKDISKLKSSITGKAMSFKSSKPSDNGDDEYDY